MPAPAKLNLFLHATGRRPDVYHLLQSVFMLIDWVDLLDFELRPDGRISREDTLPGLPPEDLCVRAARALQEATGCTLGVHIRLDKRIPAEAGMGGGSSDAATCLLALNRLWGLGLTRRELSRIGLKLGADVPFFLGGHSAWVEGVGEQLTPVSLPPARFVVVKPPTGASTPAIFSSPELQRDTKTAILQGFAANTKAETAFTPNNDGRNDYWRMPYLDPLLGATVSVFNRYGQLVYQASGTAVNWDGTFRGIPQDTGTYVYLVQFKDGTPDMKGTFTLIR